MLSAYLFALAALLIFAGFSSYKWSSPSCPRNPKGLPRSQMGWEDQPESPDNEGLYK